MLIRARRRGGAQPLGQHILQQRAIDRRHQSWRQQAAARTGTQQPVGRGKMIERCRGEGPAGAIHARIADGGDRIVGADAGLRQQFTRQVQAPDGRVLVEIAQDVGKLQSVAQSMRELVAGSLLHAEDARRKAADSAGHATTVKVEGREIGGTDIGLDIHVHAIDHAQKVDLLQAEIAHRALQEGGLSGRPAGIERLEILAPLGECGGTFGARSRSIVGDVVDQPAVHVDRKHGLPLGLRHDAHGRVEGAAGDLRSELGGIGRGDGGHPELPCKPGWVARKIRPKRLPVTPRAPRSASAKASTA